MRGIWTQQQAADEVAAEYELTTGREASIDQGWISRLERGRLRWPSAEYRAPLRTAYQVTSDAELGLSGLRTAASSAPVLIPTQERQLEQLHGSLSRTVTDGAPTATAIDDLEKTAINHGLLLADLAADLAEVQALMDRPRPLSTTLGLTRVAAQMCGLMCLTLIKLDRRREFRKWARLARNTASETSDPETVAWVLAQEAYGHYYADDLGEALVVARDAQAAAGGVARAGAVLAAALEARILAAQGDRPGCRHTLGAAETGPAALPAADVGESAFGYDEGQRRFHEERFYGGTSDEPIEAKTAQIHDALFGDYPPGYALLAWDKDKLAGFAAYAFLWPAAGFTRSLYLKELYVAESHRRAGIGRRLMAELHTIARDFKCSRVEWTTDAPNADAQAFYAALGADANATKIFYRSVL